MNSLSVLHEHTWTSTDFPLCQFGLSAAALGGRLHLPLQSWEEDGLGPASGFLCELPSGLVLLVQDFALAPTLGASVHTDAADIAERGVQSLLLEVLKAFDLTTDVVTWEQTEPGVENARLVVNECRKREGGHAV